jgi:hypothetical protein
VSPLVPLTDGVALTRRTETVQTRAVTPVGTNGLGPIDKVGPFGQRQRQRDRRGGNTDVGIRSRQPGGPLGCPAGPPDGGGDGGAHRRPNSTPPAGSVSHRQVSHPGRSSPTQDTCGRVNHSVLRGNVKIARSIDKGIVTGVVVASIETGASPTAK